MNGGSYWAVIPAAVRYDRRLTKTAKLLYAEISGLAQMDGYCWATDAYFAELLEVSPATITRAIRSLRDCGYIHIDRAVNQKGPERHIYCGLDPAKGVIVKNDGNPDDNVDDNVKNDGNPPATQYNKKNNKSTGARARAKDEPEKDEIGEVFDAFAADKPQVLFALRDFRADRRKRRKPIKTALAATRLVKKLQRLSGGDPTLMVALLDEAVERGWDSVYPLKTELVPPGTGPRRTEEAADVIDWEEGMEL